MRVLNDFTTSVRKALSEIDPKWESYNGLIVCGTHNPDRVSAEEMIEEITNARENKIPFLGICFGHQLAAIEYARNIEGTTDAVSEEWADTGTFVVKKLPKLNVGMKDGETYWNNYEVVIEWGKPEWFITTQYHPEYQSSKDKPHPILVEFLNLCRKQ